MHLAERVAYAISNMSSYLPAIERVGDMVEALARFLRGRRTPGPPAPDELQHPDSDSNSDSSSHTSVSSADWITAPQPQTPPTPAPTMTLPSFPRRQRTPPPPPSTEEGPAEHPLHITSLPLELHVLILKRLTFADIQRLRRTSRFFNSLITKPLLRDIYGPQLDAVLLSHCHICHARDPTRSTLLYADLSSPSYPFCSVCVSCAVGRDELYAGRRVAMGNYRSAWVCRWCGYPVLSDPAWREPLFHQRCYSWYGTVLLAYLFAGWLQLCGVVVGAALCLDNFRRVRMVQVPCIISLIMAFWPLILINIRSPVTDRTYLLSAVLEACLLGLWIPPTYAISKIVVSSATVRKSTSATLAFCGINLAFRLLNTAGNLVLLTEPPLWRRKKPGLPRRTRLLNRLVAFLVFWTYPRAVEQSYRPKSAVERRKFEARRL